jgi:hypothetical protein
VRAAHFFISQSLEHRASSFAAFCLQAHEQRTRVNVRSSRSKIRTRRPRRFVLGDARNVSRELRALFSFQLSFYLRVQPSLQLCLFAFLFPLKGFFCARLFRAGLFRTGSRLRRPSHSLERASCAFFDTATVIHEAEATGAFVLCEL